MFIFQTKGPPMTAAERQRRCRENGKGRYCGERMTRKQLDAWREKSSALASAPSLPSSPSSPSSPPPSPVHPARVWEFSLSALAA